MAGILDPKSRIMDVVVTDLGRQLLANGEFKPTYASFSDGASVYEITSTVSHRPLFEAHETSQFDRITFDANAGGYVEFSDGKRFTVRNGSVLSASSNIMIPITGSQFVSQSLGLMSASLDSIQKQFLLRTSDPVFSKDEFNLSKNTITFTIDDTKPISSKKTSTINVDYAHNVFQDKRFANMVNFLHLPPINKRELGGYPIGNFPNLSQQPITYNELIDSLKTYEHSVVEFIDTSYAGNIICQVFELANGKMMRLDMFHFGKFNTFMSSGTTKHVDVFFVGKVFIDSVGSHTFMNIFTLLFE
jgi:hypothetical protein